jgi:hypothetical protein
MAALARWCFQRRKWVLIAWLALLVILTVGGRAAGPTFSDNLTLLRHSKAAWTNGRPARARRAKRPQREVLRHTDNGHFSSRRPRDRYRRMPANSSPRNGDR